MSVEKETLLKACGLCGLTEDNEFKYGKIYEHDGIVTHYYCLLLSSSMEQKGDDDEGILGFLTSDIQKEIRRGKRLVCSYCKKVGATLGCCNVKCKKMFHFPCGLKDGSLHQFFGEFRTYCRKHRPKQQIDCFVKKEINKTTDLLCYICYDVVSPCDINTLWAPCCKKNAWFHRKCIQQLAMSAGYFFKCPLCNNKTEFQKTMLKFGIFIPNQDASWELVPNAFQELLYRHDQCDATTCLCPKGRKHTSSNAKWELTLCRICGSQGIHMACGQLKWANPVWECKECTSILAKAANTERSQMSTITVATDNQHGRVGHESNGSSSGDSDTDISVGCYSPVPFKAVTETNELTPQGVSIKIRPGPRSFKLKERGKANRTSERELSRTSDFNETCDIKQKIESSRANNAYNNNENIYDEKYVLPSGNNSVARNEQKFCNEYSDIISSTAVYDASTGIQNDNEVNNCGDSAKYLKNTLVQKSKTCAEDHDKSIASIDVFAAQNNIHRDSGKLFASELKPTLSQNATASSSSKAIGHVNSFNVNPVLNGQNPQIISLSPETLAGIPYLQSDIIDVHMTPTISEKNNIVELNTKRKSEVCKDVYDSKLERLKKLKKLKNADTQTSASSNDIRHARQTMRIQPTSTLVSPSLPAVLNQNTVTCEEQQTKIDETTLLFEEQSINVPVSDNLTSMSYNRGRCLSQLIQSASENDIAVEQSNCNNVRNLVKSETVANSISKSCEEISAANCFRDMSYNPVNQSTISSSTYNKGHDKKRRRKVHSLPTPGLLNYSTSDTFSNIPFLTGCDSTIDSTVNMFSHVTSNPNTCDRPRLIPEYVHLRDLKFRVMNADYVQMILYDTFSVTLNVAKCVNGNLRLNCKSSEGLCEAKSFSKAEHTTEIVTREETIKCNVKCSNKCFDYLSYVSPKMDVQRKDLSKMNCVSGDDDDDIKENLDPISSPTTDCQNSINLYNVTDRNAKLQEYFRQEDANSTGSYDPPDIRNTFQSHMMCSKNGNTELLESNLSMNKSVAESRGGNSKQILHAGEIVEHFFSKPHMRTCDSTLNVNNDAQVFQNTSPTNKYSRGFVCCSDSIDREGNALLYSKQLQSSIKRLRNIHDRSADVKCLDVNSIAEDVLKKKNNAQCTHFHKGSVVSLRERAHVHNTSCKVSIDLTKIQKLLDNKPDLFCKYM